MRRRQFLGGLGGAAIWPAAARAQSARPLIGWLGIGEADAGAVFLEGFLGGMRQLGYVEGRDFTMALRWAGGTNSRLPSLAAEILALKPAVVVVEGTRSARTFAQATSTTPIVAVPMAEPTAVKLGGDNFSHPIHNVTGILSSVSTTKLFEISVEAIPGISRCGLLIDTVLFDIQIGLAQEAAATLHLALDTSVVTGPEDIQSGLMKLKDRGAQIVIAPTSAMFRGARKQIVTLMAAAAMPAIYDNKVLVDAGGLMAYGVDTVKSYARCADQVVRLLRGTRVNDVPIEQSNPILSINLKTAKALGFTIPPMLLFRADEVIE